MRAYALIAMLAVTAYGDGHETTTKPEDAKSDDDLNTAETLF